jgi:3-hydroxyisobutyrate dehydrogenase
VRIHDPRAEALAPFAGRDGVTLAGSLAEVAEGAELVIAMLPDGKIVRAAVLGSDGLARAMAPGAVLADMSTSYPLETVALAGELEGTGIEMIDAPVSGGVRRARLGELTIMAGGDAAVIERIAPALGAMGTVYRTGALGSGHAMKVPNNYLSASGLAAACEAVLIGRRFGLDPDLMADVFNVSTGRSNATEVKLKQQVNNGRYAAGFTMELMAKDLRMAAALAGDMAVEAKGLAACVELYAEAAKALGGTADHTEVMKVIEAGG